MDGLPEHLCLKIFYLLDHQNLAAAQQVCRKWKVLASDNNLWSNLFKERWGVDRATFYAPADSKPWKNVYEVQDRCDRIGLGLKIIREGGDCYLVHLGEIQRHLCSNRQRKHVENCPSSSNGEGDFLEEKRSSQGILDRILFFIGDLEIASSNAKRRRRL